MSWLLAAMSMQKGMVRRKELRLDYQGQLLREPH